MNRPVNRRNFLKLAGLATLATTVYSYFRGVRIPPLIWEPPATDTSFSLDNVDIEVVDLIRAHTGTEQDVAIAFRAFAPEPTLRIQASNHAATGLERLRISVNNIATDAQLRINSRYANLAQTQVSETIVGITRVLDISIEAKETLELSWKLPELSEFSFAAIGDTGGGQELAWCINRAHALGARFLLHLGDFNYLASDYSNAISLFNQAPLPCYVSIGNHDAHDNGSLFERFLNEIGPLNHQFAIGKTRFANLDTASNTLPYAAGHRGRLMQQLIAERDRYIDTIAFTHRPLHDPDPQEAGDHDLGSTGERDWLVASLKKANVKTLLSGHIHIYHRQNFEGIDNIIVGQGLGHQDLITNSDYSKIAIGRVGVDGKAIFEFAPLAMPMEMHCHSRSDVVKESLSDSPHADVIRRIELACRQLD